MLSTHMGYTQIYSGLQKNDPSQGLIHCCWDIETKKKQKKTEDKWKEKKNIIPCQPHCWHKLHFHSPYTACSSAVYQIFCLFISSSNKNASIAIWILSVFAQCTYVSKNP